MALGYQPQRSTPDAVKYLFTICHASRVIDHLNQNYIIEKRASSLFLEAGGTAHLLSDFLQHLAFGQLIMKRQAGSRAERYGMPCSFQTDSMRKQTICFLNIKAWKQVHVKPKIQEQSSK